MSDINATKAAIHEIIEDHFGLDYPQDYEDDSSIKGDLGLDSLDFIELIMAMESYFSIAIHDSEAEKCTDVKSLAKLVELKIK